MKTFAVLIFTIFLAAIYTNIGLFKVISLRPQSIHQWSQCDRASVAKNYAEESFNFFKPRVHERSNGTGITGMEFPVINYIVALGYKMFGFHEEFYRSLIFLIVVAGLLSAFLLCYKFTKSYLASGFIVFLFNLSPVLVYYTPNFLPDAASLGLILVSWNMFFKIIDQDRKTEISNEYNFLFIAIASLACLIKITSLISVVSMLILIIVELRRMSCNSIKQHRKLIFSFVITFLVTIIWYSYSYYLSSRYQSYYFLLKPNGISSYNEFLIVTKKISNNLFHQYYPPTIYYLLIFINCVCLICFKKLNQRLLLITICLYAGSFGFALLMLNQFVDHDYYIITLLPAVFFNMVLAGQLLINFILKKKLYVALNLILFGLILNYSMIICKKNFNDRYKKTSWLYSDIKFDKYFDMEIYLRQLGLKTNDKVLSITDESPNNSLYLMNQKGIVIHHGNNKQLSYWLTQPVKYAVINDSSYLESQILKPHLQKLLGKQNGIFIYELKSHE